MPIQLYGQSASNQSSNQGSYSQYENPEHKIGMSVPSNWTVTENKNTINFSSPLEGESDRFREGLLIEILPTENLPLSEYASLGIIALREGHENFTLTYSNANFVVSNYSTYSIIYTYVNNTGNYKALRIWTVTDRNSYGISYDAELDKFDMYFPLIEKMVSSLQIETPAIRSKPVQNIAGLTLRDRPYNVVVDDYKNRIYVSNSRSGTISVIDGQNDSFLNDIKVGLFPSGIEVDPGFDRLYVTNRDSNTISVIDGSTNNIIDSIEVGAKPVDIVIDPDEKGSKRLIFVSNQDSDFISVIDGSTNNIIDSIEVRDEPVDLAINTITNRLYVANYQNNTVSVIDYHLPDNGGLKHEIVANLKVGKQPASIDFNPTTNKLYVSNSESNSVSVINGSTDEVITNDISVETNPYGIAVNTDENLVYVANYLSNSISVINGSTDEVIKSISVNRFPFTISYNPITKLAYVTHLTQNLLSIINDTDQVVGVTFEISPANSGFIKCNGNELMDGDYLRYNINAVLKCQVISSTGFFFSSWSGDITQVSSSPATFNVSRFGNITANFKELIIPWDQLSLLLIGIIIPAIAGWSIPAIASWLNGVRQRRHLEDYMTKIYKINKIRPQDEGEFLRQFEKIKDAIEKALTKGNISESQYEILSKILEDLKPNR